MTPAPWVIIAAAVTGAAGLLIGSRKGHPVWGFFLGLLLSVIGLVIIAVTRPAQAQSGQHREPPAGPLAAWREARRDPGDGPPTA